MHPMATQKSAGEPKRSMNLSKLVTFHTPLPFSIARNLYKVKFRIKPSFIHRGIAKPALYADTCCMTAQKPPFHAGDPREGVPA